VNVMAKLFSIRQEFSDKIFSKEKLVEFRRQNVNVNKGEICIVYTSGQVKKITGYFKVKEKLRLPIMKLWNMTKKIAGITKKEFMKYFEGCKYGTAIFLMSIKKFSKKISLEELRKKYAGFRPPQSYLTIDGQYYYLFSDLLPQKVLTQCSFFRL